MPVLVGISIDYKGKTFDLEDEEITIGRADENMVTLNNSSISTRHCMLSRTDAGYRLKDLNSTNGTRVNGQPVTEITLQDRDVIHFGALEFIFADQQPENVDVDALTTQIISPTKVEVSDEPSARPDSFSSVSPFAAQRTNTKTTWVVLIGLIGVLALVCVGLLFYILFVGG